MFHVPNSSVEHHQASTNRVHQPVAVARRWLPLWRRWWKRLPAGSRMESGRGRCQVVPRGPYRPVLGYSMWWKSPIWNWVNCQKRIITNHSENSQQKKPLPIIGVVDLGKSAGKTLALTTFLRAFLQFWFLVTWIWDHHSAVGRHLFSQRSHRPMGMQLLDWWPMVTWRGSPSTGLAEDAYGFRSILTNQ